MNRAMKTIDKNQEVINSLTISDLVKVINAGNATLHAFKGTVIDEDLKILREKTQKSIELCQSLLIMGLSKTYCDFARTLNDMNESSVNQRLKRDFEIALK